MVIGFKTGPKNWAEGKRIVLEEGARMCEVWFRIDRASEYEDMFAWLARQKVAVGLHHWGLVDGIYKTNIISPSPDIRRQTVQQIKDVLDVAARRGDVYVNAHCGAAVTEKIAFNPVHQEPAPGDRLEPEEQLRFFLQATDELFAYAKERGVLLTIETLVGREPSGEDNREEYYDSGNTHYSALVTMGQRGGFIANDIAHTASQIMMEESDPARVWQKLFEFTKVAAPYTRLLHINTITPPFNGTDSHDGILPEDFALGGFPSLEQLRLFLAVFRRRDDVFVVPEPRDKMRENHLELKRLAPR